LKTKNKHYRSIVIAAGLLSVFGLPAQAEETPRIRPDVVYGHKDGVALTFDVFHPATANGAGVLFIQSGGWYSKWSDPRTLLPAYRPLLDRGFTVFCIYHGSAPRYVIPEAVADVRRAARFIRLHAKEYSIEPERLGALGGSAGGHLALMLATTGDDGDLKAEDEVLRRPSRIVAAVAMYPPTDLRSWVSDPPEVVRKIPGLKPPLTISAEQAAEASPLLHVSSETPPICLIHGDHDELVPIEHSRNLHARLQEAERSSRLLVVEGAGHSFSDKDYAIAVPAMVEWFEKYLSRKSSP